MTDSTSHPTISADGSAGIGSTDGRRSGEVLSVAPAPAEPPPGFVHDVYVREWTIERPRSEVWAWLCDPATFTDGQIPPFRVEFLTNAAGQTGFHAGVYNAHVGPLMSFSGVLGEIEHERYRDLQYFYGSYAVSHALFRPTRLQFWLDDVQHTAGGSATVLRLQLDTFVRHSAVAAWGKLMGLFWRRFGSWAERAIPNNWLR